MKRMRLFLWIMMISMAAALIGCGGQVPVPTLPGTPVPTVSPSQTNSPLPSSTSTTTQTAAFTPTITQTTTPSQTPSPSPTPVPMSIAALRARQYPGSPITIESELAAGSNYKRYYASYLSDGLKIYALLTVPNGEMPAGGWPAIVFNHGYIPPKQYRTTERYIAYVDWLARSGYIVFRIDYRGNDQSEGEASGAYGDPGYTIDVLNAVSSIQQFPQANPNKVGMWGHSMGGFLTLRAMVISPDIKVGVIWSGVVGTYDDILNHWHRNPSGLTPTPVPGSTRWRSGWIEQYGTPEENPDFWNSLSANAYLQDLSGPLQLHHSTTDEEVPYAFSEELVHQAQQAGKTIELYTYEGDNHNLANSFAQAMTRTIAFFDQYLKD